VKRIALVIVTFNRCHLLSEMIDSVLKMTLTPEKIFVIDNNSQDDTKKIVDGFVSKNETLFEYYNTGYNSGGAGGFAIGSKMAVAAGYEYIWMADDDIAFDKYCLERLVPQLSQNKITQPMRFNTDGSCAEISATVYNLSNPFFLRPKRQTVADIYTESKKKYDIVSIPFEGPVIPAEIFKKIGFPDERFFIFNDDLDFSIRALKAGFGIECLADAKIIRKIKFEQSLALKTWKSYFMFRNYFRVQKMYKENSLIWLRMYGVLIGAALYQICTLDLKNLKTLISSFKDGVSKNFNLNEKYKP